MPTANFYLKHTSGFDQTTQLAFRKFAAEKLMCGDIAHDFQSFATVQLVAVGRMGTIGQFGKKWRRDRALRSAHQKLVNPGTFDSHTISNRLPQFDWWP